MLLVPQTVCPHWGVFTIGPKGRGWIRVLHPARGFFPLNSRIRVPLWDVHVHFDCAGSHKMSAALVVCGISIVNSRIDGFFCNARAKPSYVFCLNNCLCDKCGKTSSSWCIDLNCELHLRFTVRLFNCRVFLSCLESQVLKPEATYAALRSTCFYITVVPTAILSAQGWASAASRSGGHHKGCRCASGCE